MSQPYHHGALRTALLEAAEAILDRDGIAGLTLRAVAREAGVSHAAPTHHFGDLSGLLSALAALGFIRLRERLEAEVTAAGPAPGERLIALGRAYVGFARSCPGLFQLMFRSERLDWSSPGLSIAAEAAFALLSLDEPDAQTGSVRGSRPLAVAMTRWSLVHGLSTLLVDGRLGPLVNKAQGDIDTVVEAVLASLVFNDTGTA
jgi:AcrR family transcriptional regulator